MSETPPMDDYDAGVKEGLDRAQRDMNRIIALKEDLAYEKGYEAGQKLLTPCSPTEIKIVETNADMVRLQLDIPDEMYSKLIELGKSEITAEDYASVAITNAVLAMVANDADAEKEE